MRVKLSHIFAGGAVYAGATAATYSYFASKRGAPGGGSCGGGAGDAGTDLAGGAGAGSCAFDRLAGAYDSTVGAEETYMMYGLMR